MLSRTTSRFAGKAKAVAGLTRMPVRAMSNGKDITFGVS